MQTHLVYFNTKSKLRNRTKRIIDVGDEAGR